MRIETAPSYPVSIFIAGDYAKAISICSTHCDDIGLCVTVSSTAYVFTGGVEQGVVVGFINYPRFPSDLITIEAKAIQLGYLLTAGLRQQSFSVQTPAKTTWFSYRPEDCRDPSECAACDGFGRVFNNADPDNWFVACDACLDERGGP